MNALLKTECALAILVLTCLTFTASAAQNRAPVANNDSYTVEPNTPTSRLAPGILANDTDADGNPLSAVLLTTVGHGTLHLDPSGSFTYTPTTGFTGTDSFTYQASDGKTVSNTAAVTFTVVHVNHPPVAGEKT